MVVMGLFSETEASKNQGCSLFSEKTAKFWIYVPVFFLFLGGVFCPFSGFPSSTLTVVGSFRENGQVLD